MSITRFFLYRYDNGHIGRSGFWFITANGTPLFSRKDGGIEPSVFLETDLEIQTKFIKVDKQALLTYLQNATNR